MRRRNTQAFTFLAWTSFVCALSGMLIGIYTLDETLSVKGYYFKESFLPNLKKQLKSLTIISILHKIKINITNLEIYGSGINCCNMNIF